MSWQGKVFVQRQNIFPTRFAFFGPVHTGMLSVLANASTFAFRNGFSFAFTVQKMHTAATAMTAAAEIVMIVFFMIMLFIWSTLQR